ncbi:DNA-binding response regulator [Streptomyces sp. NPDC001027]|uniref:DNA-binding response regulator n=1 Tax=Streptomyces sp. NPDC001027 TaxID=3154771 RepID=UPI00331F64A6
MSVPVIVVSPRLDTETVVEVFQGGVGCLVEGDYCTCMLSSAVVAATIGHTYLSPAACAALRDAVRRSQGRRKRRLSDCAPCRIVELLSTGLGAQGVGPRLNEKTVRNDLSDIYAKLGTRGSTEAVLRWLGVTTSTTP